MADAAREAVLHDVRFVSHRRCGSQGTQRTEGRMLDGERKIFLERVLAPEEVVPEPDRAIDTARLADERNPDRLRQARENPVEPRPTFG
jgi:hypothetical protein